MCIRDRYYTIKTLAKDVDSFCPSKPRPRSEWIFDLHEDLNSQYSFSVTSIIYISTFSLSIPNGDPDTCSAVWKVYKLDTPARPSPLQPEKSLIFGVVYGIVRRVR
eukprot:232012-Amorphochlora_amoeboformis.AAC.1